MVRHRVWLVGIDKYKEDGTQATRNQKVSEIRLRINADTDTEHDILAVVSVKINGNGNPELSINANGYDVQIVNCKNILSFSGFITNT